MNTTIQNTTKYKNSPLGLIPEDWDIKTLGEVTDYIKGFAFSSSDYTTEGIRIIRISDTTSTSIKDEGAIYMNIDDAPKYKKWELQLNDLVFTTVGSRPPMYDSMVGKVIKIEDKYKGSFLNQNAVIIRAKENTNQEFIYSQFKVKRYLDFIETIVRGNANQVSITLDNLFKYQLLFPSSEEQKAIADCLSTWDKAIEKQNVLIAQKELSKKALMQQLLSGKKRLKGFSGEWKEYSYGEILKVVKRSVYWNDDELYKLISVRRRSGGIFYREALLGSQIMVKNLRNVNDGDFLFSKMQIVHGASALVTKEFADSKISGSYIACVAKNEKELNMDFFNWLSKLPYFYHQTYISSYGVHIEKMTFDFESFLSLDIKLPNVGEQTAIVNVLQCADDELQLLKKKLEQLKEQKKGLMQVLLTGKKRMKY